jgi:hypothetical protein
MVYVLYEAQTILENILKIEYPFISFLWSHALKYGELGMMNERQPGKSVAVVSPPSWVAV